MQQFQQHLPSCYCPPMLPVNQPRAPACSPCTLYRPDTPARLELLLTALQPEGFCTVCAWIFKLSCGLCLHLSWSLSSLFQRIAGEGGGGWGGGGGSQSQWQLHRRRDQQVREVAHCPEPPALRQLETQQVSVRGWLPFLSDVWGKKAWRLCAAKWCNFGVNYSFVILKVFWCAVLFSILRLWPWLSRTENYHKSSQ